MGLESWLRLRDAVATRRFISQRFLDDNQKRNTMQSHDSMDVKTTLFAAVPHREARATLQISGFKNRFEMHLGDALKLAMDRH